MSRFRNTGIATAVGLAVIGGAFAITSSFGAGGVIRGCYQKKSGSLRVVSATAKCRKSEKAITWNQRGPTGLPGAKGANGANGAAGASGATGAKGDTGAAGAPGTARAYGLVSKTGTLSTTRKKNVSSVGHPGAGIYCVTLDSSIDPSTTDASATSDASNNDEASTFHHSYAEVASGSPDCTASQLEVITYDMTWNISGNITAKGATDEGFFFLVP